MSNVQILVLVTLALIIVLTKAEKIQFQCDDLIPRMSSCHGFLLSQSATPNQECCAGVQDLARVAVASQAGRQAICECFKTSTLPIFLQPFSKQTNFISFATLLALCQIIPTLIAPRFERRRKPSKGFKRRIKPSKG
ncbi:PREDICTED: non-specific lipid-transfer protein C, cotyledon-specific isoform-like isoform X2 [Nicotiana attenuata]|uniref:Bifunctional inhibitor/plant lipid transfer protein/seed storage helical domain-containing protein n=1 Tax=Nicotiana attenuata TaxID=49451 RepID=A0A1J6INX6_NICAT|nr:PREDICTED: non-specific lipid-transfer protein C, cotyledon-specific isoform-like isoform X2 [Nicotiana attenuata]OIT02248.1 hypothetical protein A4A49_09378 [Nicotiana attenuata]